MRLTRSEQEIMTTLWQAGEPLARYQIIEQSKDPSWKPSTIHILLNSLLEKGAIKEAGFVKRNKTYGRLYAPKLSAEQYYTETLFSEKNSKTLPMYFSALLHSDALTEDLVTELEEMLAKRKEELGL